MPILPPDKRIFDEGGGRSGRARRRVGGRGGTVETADTRQVICTTCVQYFPNDQTLLTERGPTCPGCLAEMNAAARSAGRGRLFAVAGVATAVALVGLTGIAGWWLLAV